MTGGFVCRMHGGMTPVVRAAAERRWERELMDRATIRRIERETGKPIDPILEAFVRYRFSGDVATWRRHVATRTDAA